MCSNIIIIFSVIVHSSLMFTEEKYNNSSTAGWDGALRTSLWAGATDHRSTCHTCMITPREHLQPTSNSEFCRSYEYVTLACL